MKLGEDQMTPVYKAKACPTERSIYVGETF